MGTPLVVVDAMNVIGAGAGGWWRDRPAAQRRLHERLATLAGEAAAGPGEVLVVFEGPPLPDLAEGRRDGVEIRWARRRGPDAGDDRIVEEVSSAIRAGAPVTVVTADRELRRRVSPLGAGVTGPSGLDAAVRCPAGEVRFGPRADL